MAGLEAVCLLLSLAIVLRMFQLIFKEVDKGGFEQLKPQISDKRSTKSLKGSSKRPKRLKS
jgi:hypothetical protein